MKKYICLTFVFTFVCLAHLHAYEFKKNPDRRPSIGFLYSHNSYYGDYSTFWQLARNAGDLIGYSYLADLRVPVSSVLTITIGGGWIGQVWDSSVGHHHRWELEGHNYSLGARVYFP